MSCQICHVPDPGNHYTQSCCRACAAFFRRTTQLRLRYRCKKVGNCEITAKNRFFCRYCRLKRCIKAGMTNLEDPDLSMTFFLDSSDTEENLPSLEETEFYSIENIFKNQVTFMSKFNEIISSTLSKVPERKTFPFALSGYQQVALAYTNFVNKLPKRRVVHSNNVDVGTQIAEGFRVCQFVAEMFMEIDDFLKFPFEDKLLLFQQVCIPLIHLHRAHSTVDALGNDPTDSRVAEICGSIVDYRKVKFGTSNIAGSAETDMQLMLEAEKDVVMDFLSEFKKLKPDEFEFTYLLMSVIFKIKDKEKFTEDSLKLVDEVQERLSEELFFYYKFEKKISNFASRIYKMRNLFAAIERMEKIREMDNRMIETFKMLNLEEN